MPTDKFRQRNPKNKQTKFQLVFDEDSRKDFLTGFEKRKKARKKIAQQEADEKMRKEKREERQKRREALEEELKSIRLPDAEPKTRKKEAVVIDHPSHTVTVTSTLNLHEEHGGIGENKVDYDNAEDDISEKDEEQDDMDDDDEYDERENGDAAEDRLVDDVDDEEPDKQKTSVRDAKSKKKEIFNKRRQQVKKQAMKKKRGASQGTIKKMKSMKRKSLGKFMKRGASGKRKGK